MLLWWFHGQRNDRDGKSPTFLPLAFLQAHRVAHESPHASPRRIPHPPLGSQRSRLLGKWVSTEMKKYAEKLIEKFRLKDYKIVGTPLAVTEKLSKVDGSEAAAEDDMRSTLGYAFTLGSGVFSWASIKQSTMALSTAEAKYVSVAEATSQAKWLRFVLEDFGENQVKETQIMCDNTSVIAMAKNLEIELVYCKAYEQIADILTKALPKDRFAYLRELMGVKIAKG
ncbi:hypothetical protein D8674_005756 [Pyrus ussuriensis x Pyrus communis]|uniref:Retrovirus-related Pol polyprotein from transposon TNT 1-94 n=1 Tax=Pyrus ussuriensis x Pyrus communis TaxID=2448454 RepID=A0A5N5FSB1_9ROSA|nr:hypothetical protein D8674_005756 [Pyrus ussuriensis x Pyrus communis]